jgi:hypothetical protein
VSSQPKLILKQIQALLPSRRFRSVSHFDIPLSRESILDPPRNTAHAVFFPVLVPIVIIESH